jgi:glycerophosphoryl diester phosphodiesterase
MRLLLCALAALPLLAQPLVIAHRGGKAIRSENTMAAFRQSITVANLSGAVPFLEADAVMTSDGRLIVHHDLKVNPQLCRLDGRTVEARAIRLMSFAETQRYDCGSVRHPDLPTQRTAPGARMPALEELLELVADSNAVLFLETKMAKDGAADFVAPATVVEAIDLAVRRYGLSSRVILQSADHRTLAEMKKRNAQVRLCMLNPQTRLPDYVGPAQKLGAQIQFINFRIIEARDVAALHAAGIQVYSGTTDDPKVWDQLIALGVDAILTDRPGALQIRIGKR